MQLKCSICNRKFFYFKIPGHHVRTPPNICGYRARNGKWISNQICFILRRYEYTQRHREKRQSTGFNRYALRGTPQLKFKNRCVNIIIDSVTGKSRRCNKITANNGTNRFYCQRCWDHKQEIVSEQYPDSIYEVESRVEDLQGFMGIGKVRK